MEKEEEIGEELEIGESERGVKEGEIGDGKQMEGLEEKREDEKGRAAMESNNCQKEICGR